MEMGEEFYTVEVDVRETVEVRVSFRDCLNGIKSISKGRDRVNIAFKLLEAVIVEPKELTEADREIAVNWLEITLNKFKDVTL